MSMSTPSCTIPSGAVPSHSPTAEKDNACEVQIENLRTESVLVQENCRTFQDLVQAYWSIIPHERKEELPSAEDMKLWFRQNGVLKNVAPHDVLPENLSNCKLRVKFSASPPRSPLKAGVSESDANYLCVVTKVEIEGFCNF